MTWLPATTVVGHGACCSSCARGNTCEGSCPARIGERWQGTIEQPEENGWLKVAAAAAAGALVVLALGGHPFAWIAGRKVFP